MNLIQFSHTYIKINLKYFSTYLKESEAKKMKSAE